MAATSDPLHWPADNLDKEPLDMGLLEYTRTLQENSANGDHLGTTLEPPWNHLGTTLEPPWSHWSHLGGKKNLLIVFYFRLPILF